MLIHHVYDFAGDVDERLYVGGTAEQAAAKYVAFRRAEDGLLTHAGDRLEVTVYTLVGHGVPDECVEPPELGRDVYIAEATKKGVTVRRRVGSGSADR